MRVTRHHSCRVSPFGHPRIHARLAAPRGLSQPPTSFIGSQCQGIHHAPLNTYKHKNQLSKKKLHINKTKTTPPNPHPKEGAGHRRFCSLDARNHYPQIKHHTPPPKRGDNTPPRSRSPQENGLVVSKPNSVSGNPPPAHPADETSVVHPAAATTAHGPITASPLPNGKAFSWCSLERR